MKALLFSLSSLLLGKIFGKTTSTRKRFRDLFVFLIVGALGQGITFLTLMLLKDVVGMWYVHATFLATLTKRVFTFFSHKKWTFNATESKGVWQKILAYIGMSMVLMSLNTGSVYLLVEKCGLSPYVAYAILIPPMGLLSFFFTRVIIAQPIRPAEM